MIPQNLLNKKTINEIKLLCVETGEIKTFAGAMSVHIFMKDHKGWLVYN